jgi:glycosyltransferase involved in cell wall biosynthesis
VIPIGIDLDGDSQKKIYSEIKERGLNLLCVASLVPNKGIHLLVDAMSELIKKNYNVNCTFVGQEVSEHQEYLRSIKRQINENKLTKRIVFHGWTSDVKTLLLKNDVFILPSISEGLSRAILEAMYVGMPVIAYDTGALSEIIDENVGKLMKKDDHNSISEAVKIYLNNENLIKIHGQEARKRVENQYTLSEYLENMNQFYESCLGSHKR